MSSTDLQALYRDQVLKHSRAPKHFRRIDNADHEVVGNNPLCGDSLRVYVAMHDELIEDIAFEGSGCAISVASASMMTEMLHGQPREQALQTIASFFAMLENGGEAEAEHSPATNADQAQTPDAASTGTTAAPGLLRRSPIAALGAVRQYPTRIKCAKLAWQAARSALRAEQQTVSTE